MKELYRDADDVLGLNIGGDEFPRIAPDTTYEQSLNTSEHRAKIDKMTNDWMTQRWGAPVRGPKVMS